MSFFTKYNGSTQAGHVRLERMVWALIYAGLLVLVLGYFTENTQGADARALYIAGGIALALGLLAFYLRTRQRD